MISSEGGNGYNSGEWYSTTASTDVVSGCYKFVLDWSNASKPTVTVSVAEKADTDNTDQTTTGAKYFIMVTLLFVRNFMIREMVFMN